jgi:GntR family transcriptional regulator
VFDRIDPRSPTPLYEQIAGRIRVAVAAGELNEGQALPSVRQLATTLRVNPATVVQAYRELQGQGFVELKHGAGTFVKAVPAERKKGERIQYAADLVRGMMAEAARLGVNGEDLRTALDRELGKDGQ